MAVFMSSGLGLSPICQSIMAAENSPSDEELWGIYEASPKVRNLFSKEETKTKEREFWQFLKN